MRSTSRATACRSPTRRPAHVDARSCSAGSSRSRARRSCCASRSARATPSIASSCAATTTRRRRRRRTNAAHRAQGVASSRPRCTACSTPTVAGFDGRRQRVHVDRAPTSRRTRQTSRRRSRPDRRRRVLLRRRPPHARRTFPIRSRSARCSAASAPARTNEVQVDVRRARGPTSGACGRVCTKRAPRDPPFNYDAPNQQLDLYVGKADTLNVRLSSVPDADQILEFGLWQWLLDAAAVRRRSQTESCAGPALDVHAVPPAHLRAHGEAAAGAVEFTFARRCAIRARRSRRCIGRATFSRKSTARIDLDATWNEYVDDGPGAALPTRPDPNNPGAWLDRPERYGDRRSRSPSRRRPPADVFDLTEVAPARAAPRVPRHQAPRRALPRRARTAASTTSSAPSARVDFGGTTRICSTAPASCTARCGSRRASTRSDGRATQSYREGIDFTVDAPAGKVTRAGGSTMPDDVDASWVPRPNDRVAVRSQTRSTCRRRRGPTAPAVYVVPTFSWQRGRAADEGPDAPGRRPARLPRPAVVVDGRQRDPRCRDREQRVRAGAARRGRRRASRRNGVSTPCTRAPRPPMSPTRHGFPLRAVTNPTSASPRLPASRSRSRGTPSASTRIATSGTAICRSTRARRGCPFVRLALAR